ncbi:unnamed protein product [Sphacelaria rigidula]
MVNVVHKGCGYEGCSTQPSYGVAGSKKAEFCFKHATAGMVDVKNEVRLRSKRCGYEGCYTCSSYGVAGSKKAEFCSNHATTGMVDVKNEVRLRSKRCGYEGCSTCSSYGVAGSKKAEFCSKHATAGMVDVMSKRCGYEGCSTQPSYGVAGSKRAEFCSKHATTGMVDVVNKRCGYEGCPTQPSYGVAGSKKAKFCSNHATTGMIDVVSERCGYEGCSRYPSYRVAGSKKAQRCSNHTTAGVVNLVSKKCSEDGCSKIAIDKKHTSGETEFRRQQTSAHNTAVVSNTAKLTTGKGTPERRPTEGSEKSFAYVRRTKRKRAVLSAFAANDCVDASRSVCPGPRRGVVTPLLSRHTPLRADGEVSLGPRAGSRMKVELAVSSTHCDDGVRECREQVAPLSGRSSDGGGPTLISSGGGSTGQLRGSPAVVPGRMGTCGNVDVGGTKEDSDVKLKLEACGPPSRAFDQ